MSDKVLFVSLPVQSFLRSNFLASNLPAQADNNKIATNSINFIP